MGLFEDVVVNARSAANVVGKKAGQLVDISKLRLSAADVEREISRRLEALGRVVYDEKKTGVDSHALVEESISCIDELYEQLDVINDELALARNKVICPLGAAAPIPKALSYCGCCGAKLVKEKPRLLRRRKKLLPQRKLPQSRKRLLLKKSRKTNNGIKQSCAG